MGRKTRRRDRHGRGETASDGRGGRQRGPGCSPRIAREGVAHSTMKRRGMRLPTGVVARVQALALLVLLVAELAGGLRGGNGGGPSPPPPANDACTPNPCLHGGQCTVSMDGFRCSCTGQHTGTTCQKGPCPPDSSDPTHSNDPTSCRCAPGYDTDGSGTSFEIRWDTDKGAWGGTCTASKCADRPVEHSDHDERNPCLRDS